MFPWLILFTECPLQRAWGVTYPCLRPKVFFFAFSFPYGYFAGRDNCSRSYLLCYSVFVLRIENSVCLFGFPLSVFVSLSIVLSSSVHSSFTPLSLPSFLPPLNFLLNKKYFFIFLVKQKDAVLFLRMQHKQRKKTNKQTFPQALKTSTLSLKFVSWIFFLFSFSNENICTQLWDLLPVNRSVY